MELYVGKNAVIATKAYAETEDKPEMVALLKRLSTIGKHEITHNEQAVILNWLKTIIRKPEHKDIKAGLVRFYERVDNLDAQATKPAKAVSK